MIDWNVPSARTDASCTRRRRTTRGVAPWLGSAPMQVLGRRQLNRSLLARQMLLERQPRPAIEVIEHLVGMQAQVPADPYTALWSRIEGFDPAELSTLIEERRAVRATALLRTTIHLVSAPDCLRI